jgi:mono/diheme cytochrome c family protein
MGKLIAGFLLGLIVLPVSAALWFHLGHPPVAVADPPFPQERAITHMALDARIDRESVKTPPIPVNEENLVAGARIYREQCAACHGLHGLPSSFGSEMYPDAPPLWQKHKNNDVVGVSDDPPGETAWKVTNGIRLTGMPAYKKILSETEIWQVSLLLANADKPLPQQVIDMMRQPLPSADAFPATTPKAETPAKPEK